MVSIAKKCDVAAHFNHLDLRNVKVLLMTPFTLYETDDDTNGIICPKYHVAPPLDPLEVTNGRVLLITLIECNNDTSINATKRYVIHCFSYLEWMNTMMPLTMPVTSHDGNASAKCQLTEISHVASHFDHLELTNVVVLLMMPSVYFDTSTGFT